MSQELWRRAEELFHAALEQPPEARQSFLDEACGEDTELRRQVDMLISKDEQAGSLLEKPVLADATATPGARRPLVGTQYGPYRILSPLGAGGMGEVYRARDSKLGRDVAIKTLPPEFARDPDRIARFNREAKLLASLNHPNIAAIYGLEESGGTQFLVLELVEGETLADQIKHGPIPVEECLKLALQIVEALETAHEKGVIHRDLKPANIKVTPEDKVKVLDFGLAKALAGEQAELNPSNSPTLSNVATQQGVILGTAAYMSPEQARGKPVDKRADIWAFGCVLFEMLTGRAVFSGKDVTDILAAVIRSEPDWSRLPANLHWRLRELLERCLEKEARNRYGVISDARVDIQKVLADPSGVIVQPVTAMEPRTKPRIMLPWLATTIVLSLIVGGLAVWKLRPPEPHQVMRFDYELPEGQEFSDPQFYSLAISPDGRRVVYSTPKGLYLRPLDELSARPIVGTEGSTQQPFFSPDGQWIGYFSVADRKLKKVAVNGGTPIPLCDVAQRFWGCWWNEDGTIIYGLQAVGIMRVSANGGNPECILKQQKSGSLVFPQILPDGMSVLYTSLPVPLAKIMVQSLKSGEPKELFRGMIARYLPTGHIISRSPDNRNLLAIPFDLQKLEIKAKPVPILEGVGDYAISETGTLAYIPSGWASTHTLVWVNREGKEEPLPADPDAYWSFRISPDGTRVALTVGHALKENICIWDLARHTMTRLQLDEGTDNSNPLWTPDGKRIVYSSRGRENVLLDDLYCKAADGTGDVEKLTSSSGRGLTPWSWSEDGKTLVLSEQASPPQAEIALLSMEGDHAKKPLLQVKGGWQSQIQPRISHDGRWMAYTSSDESGKAEIYVCPFPDVNTGGWQISTDGGHSPLWSPVDRELFYRNRDAVMAVRVEMEPTFKYGKATVLFRGKYYDPAGTDTTYWDISPDGKRFLMMKEAAGTGKPAAEAPRKINIVVNWTEELKQRVPVK